MKKFFALLLALCMLFALVACTTDPGTETDAPKTEGNTSTEDVSITLWTYPIGGWGNSDTVKALTDKFEAATPGIKLRQSWATTKEFVSLVWLSLGELVRGRVGLQDLSGPVGIVDLMAETGEQAATTGDALRSIFYLGAFIAVNLAVMNMLPIPALDGGRVFLLLVTWLIESLTRKKLDPRYEGAIHTVGMVLLLGLMALVMFNDIFKLIRG